MKFKQLSLWLAGVLVLRISQFTGHAGSSAPNKEALVAEVCSHVKALRFNTDRPVQSVRLVIDGKVVGSNDFHSSANGFGLAVIIPPHGKQEIEVYYDVSNRGMGGFLKGSFREIREANVMVDEYYGSGTNVAIRDWAVVYSFRQHYISGLTNPPALYEMKVEIR